MHKLKQCFFLSVYLIVDTSFIQENWNKLMRRYHSKIYSIFQKRISSEKVLLQFPIFQQNVTREPTSNFFFLNLISQKKGCKPSFKRLVGIHF
jgi:hypothetical protein